MNAAIRTIARLVFSSLVAGYFVSPVMAAKVMTGVISETALACDSAKLDVIVPLLRKADPNGHKFIEQSLKKGDCVEINTGTPVTIVGKDSHSGPSRNNYLIWHSNGKVYSLSENKVVSVSAVSHDSPRLHPSTTAPSTGAILPPLPTPAITPISVSAERPPQSIDQRHAILNAWWLALDFCFPIAPVPLSSLHVLLATNAGSREWWLLSLLEDPSRATVIAIIGIAGLVGLSVKRAKRPIISRAARRVSEMLQACRPHLDESFERDDGKPLGRRHA